MITGLFVGALVALAGVVIGARGQGWADHWTLHYKLRTMSRTTGAHLYCSQCNRWFPKPPPDVRHKTDDLGDGGGI